MELMIKEKKGFKRTEVGLIPEDWEVYNFAELFDFLKTGSLSRRHLNNEGDTYYIHYGDIHAKWKRILDFDIAVVPKVDAEKVRGLPTLEEGDLIIADASEDYEGVGASVEVKNLNGKRAVSGLHTILLRGKKDLIVDGLKAYLTHIESVRDRLKQVSTGTTVYGISKSKLKDVEIPLPPTLEEQQAIASALSDVDELIRSLDGLIQKKQAIKKGTMQQLLTGKKRLAGFDGEWEEMKLGELADIQRGASPRPISDPRWFSDNKEVGWVRISDISKSDGKYLHKTRDYLSEEGMNRSRYLESGSLIMSIAATVGLPVITQMDLCIHDGFVGFWNLRGVDKEFLFYKLKFHEEEFINAGQTGSQNNINSDIVKNFESHFPSVKEQKAIAQILSDMDRELQTLRQKREKYVQIKQGMMQELLTGKVRLVKKEAEAAIHQMPQKRNENFEDAVLIAAVIRRFGSGDFKLNRFRYQKFVYLLKRYVQASTENYKKKAAGPYNPKMRYRGGESVAIKKGYIEELKHNGYDCFTTGNKVEVALEYFQKWHGEAPLQWLDQLQYNKSGELELLTTVDMAMQEISKEGRVPNVQSVVEFIETTPKWKKKLEKPEFTESGIEQGIQRLEELFAT